MQAKQARAAAQSAPQIGERDDDETPEDIDAIRNALARRINQLISDRHQRWHTCREPSCKRARACRAPRVACVNPKPVTKPSKPEQVARLMAKVQRALRDRIEQMDAERAAQKTGDKSHKKS